MNEPTIETLARRLDRVERENRRMKQAGVVALAVIVAVGLMGQVSQSKVAKVIEAEMVSAQRFILKDESGEIRGGFTVDDEGPSLLLTAMQGKASAILRIKPPGVPLFALYDAHGNRRTQVVISRKGSAGFLAFDKQNRPRGALLVLANGNPGVLLRDDDRKDRFAVILDNGSPRMRMLDKTGKVIWSAP